MSDLLRARAVRSLLIEEVAAVSPRRRGGKAPDDVALRSELERSQRRALGVVALCWTALAVLFLTHAGPEPFLPLAGVETVFTVSVVVVAAFSGFRLGQWEKYRAVSRVLEGLGEEE
jgi:hypothetical protein